MCIGVILVGIILVAAMAILAVSDVLGKYIDDVCPNGWMKGEDEE